MRLLLYLTLLLYILLGFTACRNNYKLMVQRPGDLSIPMDLDTIVIVDRTKYEKNGGSILEGVLTGEAINSDRRGKDLALEQLVADLSLNERIKLSTMNVIEVTNDNNSLETSTRIKSEIIDSICEKHKADAVLALEFFDSDTYETWQPNQVGTESQVYLRTLWVLYYKKEQRIIDNYKMSTNISNVGLNRIFGIPVNYGAVKTAGKLAATNYYQRMLPHDNLENRSYYRGGSKEIKYGKKALKLGDIESAIYQYESAIEYAKSDKIKRRAHYNLSLCYEITDELNKAIDHAEIAWKFGDRRGLERKQLLIQRLNETDLIKLQLETEKQ